MPNFDYICEKCGFKDELLFMKHIDIKNVMNCPACKCRLSFIRQIAAGQPPIFKGRLNKNWHPSAISDMGEPDGSSGF